MLMVALVRTLDLHVPEHNRCPTFKPSIRTCLQVAGLQEPAMVPSKFSWQNQANMQNLDIRALFKLCSLNPTWIPITYTDLLHILSFEAMPQISLKYIEYLAWVNVWLPVLQAQRIRYSYTSDVFWLLQNDLFYPHYLVDNILGKRFICK